MNAFRYADPKIEFKEMVIIVANFIIGVGILTFPRALADRTGSVDGWMSVMISGAVACLCGWLLAKLASRFPQQNFFEYTALIATRPVAWLLSFLIGIYAMLFTAYEVRAVGNIAKQYLFTATPVEMITLTYLLIVQYAVAGSRIALLRLNLLFLPIVLLVILFVHIYTLRFFEMENLRPFFSTNWTTILKGSWDVGLSYSGFEVVLFYTILMRRPADSPKAVVTGLSIPMLLYMTIYVFTIGVFSPEVTKNLVYPSIELAKAVEVPGGFIERVESLFFTIWIMTLFNTSTMYLDVAIMNFSFLFRSVKRFTWILILSPVIYLCAMLPENLVNFFTFGDQLTYFGLIIVYLVPILILCIAKLRGVRGDG